MKRQIKNLLPRIIFDREALNHKLSKITPRFPKRFQWAIIVLFIVFTFGGYYPVLSNPPIIQHVARAQTDQQSAEVIAKSFSRPLILPHPGYLTTEFSTWHPGIDIATGLGMPIHPILDGIVLEAGFDIFGLGNYVTIEHQNGFVSKYAHMGKIFVKKGDTVTDTTLLGEVGLTGHTSGPHTHLEITLHGHYVDPQKLLPEIPNLPQTLTAKK